MLLPYIAGAVLLIVFSILGILSEMHNNKK